ncbi:L,D-transpeptidase family protein [Sphingomonas sinipercae]|uniref:L,D-transpeptidase family protein n=1 Tax=Sphingomonas sinipercae TaxID=2714944 RepID=A0A6G7ZLF7_9SPHN|nr:L,D-transpeptidase family protein [Sphingomonas sinipercae]QIL01814.1 L,D-transpeptidase family protein [Sphingomonas sinipercae]
MNHRLLAALAATALSSPLAAASPSQLPDPLAVPASVAQGLDFVYVDPQLRTAVQPPRIQPANSLLRTVSYDRGDMQEQRAPNPLFVQLSQGMQQYQRTWGSLPDAYITTGATLRPGATGERVDMLRTRLGLQPGGAFDAALGQRVRAYQDVHGLPVTGTADAATIDSLNLGAEHYLQKLAVNVERARRLPAAGQFGRYVLVDSGSAEVHLVSGDRIADSMRAIVGSAEHKTPMMAVVMRNAKVNPYWNVPPELIRTMTAKKVLAQGVSYLKNYHYEVLPDWTGKGAPIDPSTIDWNSVAAGQSKILVRQKPGPWNSMGEVKFEMPNRYGIYLHDTPGKDKFAQADRWVSNGCVRLQDAKRFASWVMDGVPAVAGPEQQIDLPQPVPVYMTYLTVQPTADGVRFGKDPYDFDRQAVQQMFSRPDRMASI